MSTHERALALADKLTAAGVTATCDPRSVTPPCALLTPPSLTWDINCGGMASASWSVFLLVPNPGNADAWVALDDMLRAVDGVLPVERADFLAYAVSADSPPLPAYQVTFTEGVDL